MREQAEARRGAGHGARDTARRSECIRATTRPAGGGGGGGGRHDTVLERQDMATCALPGRGLCVLAGLCVHTVHLTSF